MHELFEDEPQPIGGVGDRVTPAPAPVVRKGASG
jgi:hypothetical protein